MSQQKKTFDQDRKYCTHKTHRCYLPTFENYSYCYRHILEDRNSPFRQCSFTYSFNKRCNLPAPKTDRKELISYCKKHADLVHLTKAQSLLPDNPAETPEKLFSTLSHYADCPTSSTEDKNSDPFQTILNAAKKSSVENSVFNFNYESDNDLEDPKVGDVWNDAENDTSDTDNIESEPEDYIKNAGVYSAEEILKLTKSKLIRLEKLYVEQFKYYQYFLREKRRKYLHSLKKEKELYSSIHDQPNNDPNEKEELKLLNHYQRNTGFDANLSKKVRESRLKITPGLAAKGGSTFSRCVFADDGVKCSERQLPATKYCRKHILKDSMQVLFRPCGAKPVDTQCEVPVFDIFPDATCIFHKNLPEIRSYKKIKKDDDSDMDDSSLNELISSVKIEDLSNNSQLAVDQSFDENKSLTNPTVPVAVAVTDTQPKTNKPDRPVYCPTAEEKQHALEMITLKHLLGGSMH